MGRALTSSLHKCFYSLFLHLSICLCIKCWIAGEKEVAFSVTVIKYSDTGNTEEEGLLQLMLPDCNIHGREAVRNRR